MLDQSRLCLHLHDTHLLILVLLLLRQLGNTVVVVEHDEDMIRACDDLIDIGPAAGQHGGEVVFQGPFANLASVPESLTTQYLTGTRQLPVPASRRTFSASIKIMGARENNLKK